jgi:hypothetical protein
MRPSPLRLTSQIGAGALREALDAATVPSGTKIRPGEALSTCRAVPLRRTDAGGVLGREALDCRHGGERCQHQGRRARRSVPPRSARRSVPAACRAARCAMLPRRETVCRRRARPQGPMGQKITEFLATIPHCPFQEGTEMNPADLRVFKIHALIPLGRPGLRREAQHLTLNAEDQPASAKRDPERASNIGKGEAANPWSSAAKRLVDDLIGQRRIDVAAEGRLILARHGEPGNTRRSRLRRSPPPPDGCAG